MKYRGVFGTITTMVRTEGPRSLYNGLVAGLQRQMSFASVRIGLYDSMKQFYTRNTESEYHCVSQARLYMYLPISSLPLTHTCHTGAGIVTRLLAGCTTGAMAVAFAQPTDVVKVRFQAQVRLADGGRRYNGTLDAYKTIARDEGVRGLWKGASFTFFFFLNLILFMNQYYFEDHCLLSYRLHAQHHPQCHCKLCRAGHVRRDQRAHPEV